MPKVLALLIVGNVLALVLVLQFQNSKHNNRVLALQTSFQKELTTLLTQRDYWKNIVAYSPTYRDGYIQLAVIEYKLKNQASAHTYLQKVFEIDPNYELPITLSFLQPLISLR